MAQLTEDQAKAIYQILVDICKASAHEHDLFGFVFHQTKPQECTEWRFQGCLGFGGKFWRNSGKWYVSGYQEDYTPERKATMAEANVALAALKDSYGLTGYDV